MNNLDDLQNQLDAGDPAQQPAGGNDQAPFYYRPASGMSDWAARIAKFSPGRAGAGGMMDAPDLQTPAQAIASPEDPENAPPATMRPWPDTPDFMAKPRWDDGAPQWPGGSGVQPPAPHGMESPYENLPQIIDKNHPLPAPEPIPPYYGHIDGNGRITSPDDRIELLSDKTPGAVAPPGANDRQQAASPSPTPSPTPRGGGPAATGGQPAAASSSPNAGGTGAAQTTGDELPFESKPYDAMMNAYKNGTLKKSPSADEQRFAWSVQQYNEAMAGNKPYSFDLYGRLSLNGPDKLAAYDQFVSDGLLLDQNAGDQIRKRLAQGLPVDTGALGSYSARSFMKNGSGDLRLSTSANPTLNWDAAGLNWTGNNNIVRMADGRYGVQYRPQLDNPRGNYVTIPLTPEAPRATPTPSPSPRAAGPAAAPATPAPTPQQAAAPQQPPPPAPRQNARPAAPQAQPRPALAQQQQQQPPAQNVQAPNPNARAGIASRDAMAQQIVDFEARRDNQGHLLRYHPPGDDGGGAYEVAGINAHYDRPMVDRLRQLLAAGRYAEAETAARNYIAQQTDAAAHWTSNPAIEFFLRDTIFNRGQGGAAMILQSALGVHVDGGVGPQTLAAERQAEADPAGFLQRLRQAREQYEDQHVGYRANLHAGLVNRWNNALQHSRDILQAQPAGQ